MLHDLQPMLHDLQPMLHDLQPTLHDLQQKFPLGEIKNILSGGKK